MALPLRTAAWAALLASLAALAVALGSEHFGGLVPCELCLWQRWPYRVTAGLALLALVLPRFARPALWGAAVIAVVGAGLALTHVGVEQGWWPSPLPSCAAPTLGGGSIAERLARMPDRPAKPCDAPAYLLPAVPVSMAAMNLLFAATLAAALATAAVRREV